MADYNVGTTGIVITANVENAINSLNRLRTTITAITSSMGKIENAVEKTGNELDKTTRDVRELREGFRDLPRSIDKADNSFRRVINNGIRFTAVIVAFRAVARFAGMATQEVANFGENVNLFNVAMRSNSEQALRFQFRVSQMYGANLSNTMKYQGQFMNIGQALGINTEMAYKMSEALTLLTYDLASLYNWTDDMAYNRLLAGLVGQTKPLRYAGIDVTQQTIQPILGELGIDKSVIQLTQQEKVMLRMIAVLRQSTNAHNDYGRTIESVSNQMKVFQHQVTEIMRWIGALWFQITQHIMPIMNGLAMVVKEVAKAFAILLGFDMKDFDFVSGNMESGFVDLEDQINDADTALKKIKGSLRKFDEVNNITRGSSATGGVDIGGLSSSMTLQQALNDEIDKYRAKLSDVSMKAHEIRDSIMRWLGFSKLLNEETGEISFVFTGISRISFSNITTSMSNLWESIKRFSETALDILINFYDNFLMPISTIIINETVPLFIETIAGALDFFTTAYNNGGKEALSYMYNEFLIPISRVALTVINNSLKFLLDVLTGLGNWARENPQLSEVLFRVIAVLLLTKGLMGVGAILLKIASPLTLIAIAIGAILIYNYDDIKKWWDSLNPSQQMLTGIGLLATGIFAVAMSVMALQSAWTLGIGAVAIVAGITAMSLAVENMKKGLPTGAPTTPTISGNRTPVRTTLTPTISGNRTPVRNTLTPTISGNRTPASTTIHRPPSTFGGVPAGSFVKYATGGFPSRGEMFVMNEEKPEWIGNLGGRTAVMNQDQVVKSVLALVDKSTNAMSNSRSEQSQVVNLYADDILLGKAVIKSINKTSLATGLTIK